MNPKPTTDFKKPSAFIKNACTFQKFIRIQQRLTLQIKIDKINIPFQKLNYIVCQLNLLQCVKES